MKPFKIFKVATAIFSLSLVACVKEIGKLPKDPGFETISFRFDNNITLKEGQTPADLSASFGNIGRLTFEGNEITEPVRYEFVNGEGDEQNALFAIQGAQVKLIDKVPNTQVLNIRVKATDAKFLSIEKPIKIDVQLNSSVILPNMNTDAENYYILPCSCLFSTTPIGGFSGGRKSPEIIIENIFNFTTAGINMAQVSPEDKLKYDAWANKSAKYFAISLEREIGLGGRNAKILFYNVPIEKNSMNGYTAERLNNNNRYITIKFASGALSTAPTQLGGDFGFSTKPWMGFDLSNESTPYKYKMYIYFFSAAVKFFPNNLDVNEDFTVIGTLDNFRNGSGLNAERIKLLDYKTIKLTYTPSDPILGGPCN